MTDRARLRRGRSVAYNPTSAEETANGAGPWLAMITNVNADGTVDLLVDVPGTTEVTAAVLADPLITTADADATYGSEESDLINEIKADLNIVASLVNELRDNAISRVRASIAQGPGPGQFLFEGAGLAML